MKSAPNTFVRYPYPAALDEHEAQFVDAEELESLDIRPPRLNPWARAKRRFLDFIERERRAAAHRRRLKLHIEVTTATANYWEPKRRRAPFITLAVKLWCIPPLAALSLALAYQLLRRGLL